MRLSVLSAMSVLSVLPEPLGRAGATGAATGGDQSKAGSTRKGANVETSWRDEGNDEVTGACCWATGTGTCDCTAFTGSGAEGTGSGCFAICRAGATGAA